MALTARARKKALAKAEESPPPGLAVEYVPIAKLAPMPGNPRRNAAAVGPVAESLKRFGWTNPILARRADRVVVAGHTRLEAAKALKLDKVPVIWLDLDPVSSRLYNLADNKLAQISEWDPGPLADMLRELSKEDAAGLAIAGFGDAELAKLLTEAAEPVAGATDEDEVPADPLVVNVEQGDVWTLGAHRLLCGDCRSFADVERLAAGARVNVCVTSPPYASQRAYDESSGFKPIHPDAYVEWFRDVSANVLSVLAEDGSYFVNIKEHCEDGQRSLYVKDLVLAHVREWGWQFVDEFCWTHGGTPKEVLRRFKNGWEPIFQLARGGAFKFRPTEVMHECEEQPARNGKHPAKRDGLSGGLGFAPKRQKGATGLNASLQGTSEGGKFIHDVVAANTHGLAYPSNVLSVGKNREALGHGAAYPVGLPEFFIKAFSDAGDVVFDPFMGSGTTLIAAEKHQRRALGTEVSPRYCQVIINRWEAFTGRKAEKVAP